MKPNHRIIGGLAFAAACLTAIAALPPARAEINGNTAEVVTNVPQTGRRDAQPARSELQNVRDSDRYEWLVHPNPNFRAVRERKECGPTHDAPMQADCDASLGR